MLPCSMLQAGHADHVEGMFHGMLRLELHANPRSGFQLTSWAVQNMKFARALKNPAFVLLSDQDSPAAERCVYTLLTQLFKAGWTLEVAPKADAKRLEALPIPAGEIPQTSRKLYLVQGAASIGKQYILCCWELTTERDFRAFLRQHEVKMFKHCQPEAYYKLLLSRKPAKLQAFDFEHDMGAASSSQKEEALQVLAGALGPGRGKFRLEQSFTWGCVSFKHHKRGGLQVDCPRRSHIRHHQKSGKRMLCTYSSNYKTEEQRHEAVQRMKWWIIRGLEESCRSHSAHQEIKKQVQKAPLSALPSDQELDAQMPPASN